MDYGKHKYDKKKNKQKKVTHPLKEMNFKMRIDPHDMDIKVNRIKSFLTRGSEVKITVTMRGRERAAPQLAQQKLDFILAELKGLIQIVPQGKPTKSSICTVVRPLSKRGGKHGTKDNDGSGSKESSGSSGEVRSSDD